MVILFQNKRPLNNDFRLFGKYSYIKSISSQKYYNTTHFESFNNLYINYFNIKKKKSNDVNVSGLFKKFFLWMKLTKNHHDHVK